MKTLRRLEIYLFMLLLALPAFSLGASGDGSGKISNPLKGDGNIFAFINSVIDAAIKLGAILAVLAIIYAGFLFVTAQGDETKIETAKKVLLYTAIGIAILLGARVISSVITTTVTNVGNATK